MPTPSRGPRSAEPPRGEAGLGRRTVLELSRIYVAASAFGSALEVLDRLAMNSWDEEAHLLRAEALLGLGRTQEAEALLGPTMLPAVTAVIGTEHEVTTT